MESKNEKKIKGFDMHNEMKEISFIIILIVNISVYIHNYLHVPK